MGWILTEFKGVTLPNRLFKLTAGSGRAHKAIVKLPNGQAFDGYGSATAPVEYPIDLRLESLILASADNELFADLAALTGLVGQVGTLERETSDGDFHECTARLAEAPSQRELGMFRHEPVTLAFDQLTPWHAASPTEGTIDGMVAGPVYELMLTNDGNADSTTAVFSFECVANSLTSITIERTGSSGVKFNAAVANGEELMIDCGARSVELDGVDAYDDLIYTAQQTQEHWLVIPPGTTSVYVTLTGTGTANMTLTYYDSWQ